MTKVTFEQVDAVILSEAYGNRYQREWARCDLALPAAELRVIAATIDSIIWIEQAAEQDGCLYVRKQHDIAWLLQERAFHTMLGVARPLTESILNKLRNTAPKPSIKPVVKDEFTLHHRGAYANSRGKSYLMPEGHYGTGFAVTEDDQGMPIGYFLTTNRYEDKTEPLATAILASMFPKLGIQTWHRLTGYGEVEFGASADAIPPNFADHAVAAYDAAKYLIAAFQNEMEKLQWGGLPSAFLDEDNAARDWLLAEAQTGARIMRKRRHDAEYDDVDGVCEFTLEDGTPLTHYIVTRLQNAYALKPEGAPDYGQRDPDAPLAPLVYHEKINPNVIAPRTSCVPFPAFQSYCAHRRYDSFNECAHPKQGGEICCADRCPLTIQTYSEDVGSYGRDFANDPAFGGEWDQNDNDNGKMVRAIHRNTERSYAWRAAGEDAEIAIINQVLHAKYAMGIDQYLFGDEHKIAVRQAISNGHLIANKEIDNFGIIVRASPALIEKVELQTVS